MSETFNNEENSIDERSSVVWDAFEDFQRQEEVVEPDEGDIERPKTVVEYNPDTLPSVSRDALNYVADELSQLGPDDDIEGATKELMTAIGLSPEDIQDGRIVVKVDGEVTIVSASVSEFGADFGTIILDAYPVPVLAQESELEGDEKPKENTEGDSVEVARLVDRLKDAVAESRIEQRIEDMSAYNSHIEPEIQEALRQSKFLARSLAYGEPVDNGTIAGFEQFIGELIPKLSRKTSLAEEAVVAPRALEASVDDVRSDARRSLGDDSSEAGAELIVKTNGAAELVSELKGSLLAISGGSEDMRARLVSLFNVLGDLRTSRWGNEEFGGQISRLNALIEEAAYDDSRRLVLAKNQLNELRQIL